MKTDEISSESGASVAWSFLVKLLEWFVIVLFVTLTLDVLWGVFSRYVLGTQSRWTEEVAIYLIVWVSLIGAALTFRERGHLGVDWFVEKLDPSARKPAAYVAEFAVATFAVFVLCYGGGMMVYENLQNGQVTPALGWKTGYLYSVVPLSGLFVLGFSVEHVLRGRIVHNAEATGEETP